MWDKCTATSKTYSFISAISLTASTPPGSGSKSMKKPLDSQMLIAFSWSLKKETKHMHTAYLQPCKLIRCMYSMCIHVSVHEPWRSKVQKANFCGHDYKVALCFLLGVGELRHWRKHIIKWSSEWTAQHFTLKWTTRKSRLSHSSTQTNSRMRIHGCVYTWSGGDTSPQS